MSIPGTTSTSPELLIDVVAGSRSRRALESALREAVRNERLRPGARLPSSRALAVDLGVSRRLVVDAYAQLLAEGYLVARPGSGTRVAPRASAATPRSCARRAEPRRPRIDLFPGAPDLALFPRAAWAQAQRAALRELPDAGLGYGSARGRVELREALAEHLGRVRGAAADPGRIVVCSGYLQGLRLVAEALRTRGARRVGVEDPGFPLGVAVLRAVGLEPVPIGLDDRGLRVDALSAANPDAVLVTPAHAMPTGVVLAPERRAALLAWAREHRALVIEDDYDAEFRYDREPVGTLQGLAPDRVVLAGSASKTLAPALRLGWLLLPEALVAPVATAKALADAGSPALDQLALAHLLRRGALDRHVRAARPRYRARRAALLEALDEHLPQARVSGVAAGLHALVALPAHVDERRLLAEAERRGVRGYGLAAHCLAARPGPGLVLGYANHSERELREAVALLGALVGEQATQAA